jgi:hypothetical protein
MDFMRIFGFDPFDVDPFFRMFEEPARHCRTVITIEELFGNAPSPSPLQPAATHRFATQVKFPDEDDAEEAGDKLFKFREVRGAEAAAMAARGTAKPVRIPISDGTQPAAKAARREKEEEEEKEGEEDEWTALAEISTVFVDVLPPSDPSAVICHYHYYVTDDD